MIKTIWTCWFQGREAAPPLVRRCLETWEERNPGWKLRCLDATTVDRYVPIRRHLDLATQSVTAASLADVVRILLLHEFGGVWADATVLCNRPLDDWLPDVMQEGFFAFAKPTSDRPLASWLLAAEPGTPLVAKWCRRVLAFWDGRRSADDYFWFHRCFRELCESDADADASWSRVPKISADGPHSVQAGDRMYRPADEVRDAVDWTSPVFKLTYRLQPDRLQPDCLLDRLLARTTDSPPAGPPSPRPAAVACPRRFASLSVSTENLGDHIQIQAGLRLLSALGISPALSIDRDDEIRSAPALADVNDPVGILLNGWFKTNGQEWPPHPDLVPLFHGFHIRLFQCPQLVSPASLDYFRLHGPIGCRDPHTQGLLRSHGVEAFTTNCLTLTLPRRLEASAKETFVVSRDERIRSHLPTSIGPYEFVSHYSGSHDFTANMAAASILLDRYRTRARLIITTLLHCALPAMAMGIPVVVFYPPNEGAAHESDRERFSAIEGLVPINRLDDVAGVDWNPAPVDVSALKLAMLDTFFEAVSRRWGPVGSHPIGPIAPSSVLPPA